MVSRPVRPRSPRQTPAHLGALALLLAAGAVLGAGCTTQREADAPASDQPETTAEWTDLTDPRHWRADGGEAFPEAGWEMEDGALALTMQGGGGDLVTRESYDDFELALEWKIAPCGNSGIFYRGGEAGAAIWETAPEMQVLDDACHPDAEFPSHTAGAVYDLYVPTADVVRPAGEWNEVRIVADGPHVEHWLNGVKVAEYEQGSEEWNARVAASKFDAMPGFGTHRSGPIGLQDHGDLVWYRAIRIRRLP